MLQSRDNLHPERTWYIYIISLWSYEYLIIHLKCKTYMKQKKTGGPGDNGWHPSKY